MSVPIQPLGDYIVAESEQPKVKTASGIYLPEGAAEKPKTAVVRAVAKNAKELKVGDKIVYKTYSTTDVKIDGNDYILVREEDVLAIVK
jgi:chaperonin GroES